MFSEVFRNLKRGRRNENLVLVRIPSCLDEVITGYNWLDAAFQELQKVLEAHDFLKIFNISENVRLETVAFLTSYK